MKRGMAEGCLVCLPAVPSVGVPAVCGVRVRPLSLLICYYEMKTRQRPQPRAIHELTRQGVALTQCERESPGAPLSCVKPQ